MSYKPASLKEAARSLAASFGVPLGLFLLLALAALYVFSGRTFNTSSVFPRSQRDFMAGAKASRRIAELKAVIEADPDNMRALAESGKLKYQAGPASYVEAIADLERARSLGLAEVSSFYYLGQMYQSVGLYEFAQQEYRKFLNNEPNDAEVRMLLAKLCYSTGDFPCAQKEYERLLGARGGDPVLLENLAFARWKNGQDYQPQLEKLRAAGAQGGFLADFAEGRIAYERKDYPRAYDSLKKAAAQAGSAGDFADRAQLYWLAGDSAARVKQAGDAYAWLQELLQLNPEHQEGKLLFAKVEKARKAAEKTAERTAAKKGPR